LSGAVPKGTSAVVPAPAAVAAVGVDDAELPVLVADGLVDRSSGVGVVRVGHGLAGPTTCDIVFGVAGSFWTGTVRVTAGGGWTGSTHGGGASPGTVAWEAASSQGGGSPAGAGVASGPPVATTEAAARAGATNRRARPIRVRNTRGTIRDRGERPMRRPKTAGGCSPYDCRVSDPILDRDALNDCLRLAASEAAGFLAKIDSAPVRPPRAADELDGIAGALPDDGAGSLVALRELIEAAHAGATRSAGPRFFHFVMGGGTPAALAADWLASALDQIAFNWVSSPFAMRLEEVSVDGLKELFGLPAAWSGVLTSGATMANFTGFAAARRWWGQRHGVDVEEVGLASLPPVPLLASGYVHASAVKALAMLGIGRRQVQTFASDATGALDVDALERALRGLGGAPAILAATAGEVNAGGFDPLAAMADLAAEYGAWLHVDGAFGLFAAVSPATRHLVSGIDRAHSVAVDGHKWLNVPYDCGAAFVHDPDVHRGAFSASAAYLGTEEVDRPVFSNLGPEMSRRARAFAVWATLRAYGRNGYRTMVERHFALARRLAGRIDAEPELERLADVPLNVVCFRYRPHGAAEEDLQELNRRLGQAVLDDGRVYFGTTVYGGKVAFRPAIVNWRTREEDVDLIVPTVLELGASLVPARA
jgi:glutamate/tyrosine decarboxylase-like PLP-dependent enzyme